MTQITFPAWNIPREICAADIWSQSNCLIPWEERGDKYRPCLCWGLENCFLAAVSHIVPKISKTHKEMGSRRKPQSFKNNWATKQRKKGSSHPGTVAATQSQGSWERRLWGQFLPQPSCLLILLCTTPWWKTSSFLTGIGAALVLLRPFIRKLRLMHKVTVKAKISLCTHCSWGSHLVLPAQVHFKALLSGQRGGIWAHFSTADMCTPNCWRPFRKE